MNTNKEYIKCYPCTNTDDPHNLNGAGSKCQTFDTSFPDKNERPNDYLVCNSSDKGISGGCGNQEYILSDSINGDLPIPGKKKSSARAPLILCILGIISIFTIIMWIIYKTSSV